MTKSGLYRAFMIRLWPTMRQGVDDYRVSLQEVSSGDRLELPDLASLLTFLKALRRDNTCSQGLEESSGSGDDGPILTGGTAG